MTDGLGKRKRPSEADAPPQKRQRVDAANEAKPAATASSERRCIRIGILLTKPSQEQKKEELIPVADKRRPWLKFVTESAFIKKRLFRKGEKLKPNKRLESVPADVSIGAYIDWAYGQYNV